MSKIIPIAPSKDEASEIELLGAAAAFDTALGGIAEEFSRLRAIAWIIDGAPNHLCALGAAEGRSVLLPADARERIVGLAWALASLPDLVQETLSKELEEIHASRAAAEFRAQQKTE